MELEELENERIYCKHNIEHFLNVARIAYIFNLELGLDIDKEDIYAAALLHDVGKTITYKEKGLEHSRVSAQLAKPLLQEVGFSTKSIRGISDAILNHNKNTTGENSISSIIAKADHLSRACYKCEVESTCKWDKERKNTKIQI